MIVSYRCVVIPLVVVRAYCRGITNPIMDLQGSPGLEEANSQSSAKQRAIEAFNTILKSDDKSITTKEGKIVKLPIPKQALPQQRIEDIAVLSREYWPVVTAFEENHKPRGNDFASKSIAEQKRLLAEYGKRVQYEKKRLLVAVWPKLHDVEAFGSITLSSKQEVKAAFKIIQRWKTKNYVVLGTLPSERTKLGVRYGDTMKEVVPLEYIAEILWQVRETALGTEANHSSRTSQQEALGKYEGLGRANVRAFAHCVEESQWRAPKKPKPGNTPIRSTRVMERVQIDLIVLTSALPEKNNDYKYILTVKDHFSRYVWLEALRRKRVVDVVAFLRRVFDEFGCPTILQSDNGGEFRNLAQSRGELQASVNAKLAKSGHGPLRIELDHTSMAHIGFSELDMLGIVASFKLLWPTIVQVHGSVNASSTQGSVENANQMVQRLLYEIERAWSAKYPADVGRWLIHLSSVAKLINAKLSWNNTVSPFQVMFNRQPTQQLPPGMELLSAEKQQSLQTVTQLNDALHSLPDGAHFQQRLWDRPIEGATNSLVNASYTRSDMQVDYERYLQVNPTHELSLEHARHVLDEAKLLDKCVIQAPFGKYETCGDASIVVDDMVLAVEGVFKPFTSSDSVLLQLHLKENTQVLADGNCMPDAFLKTTHVGQAVMSVMATCPTSIASMRTQLQMIARMYWNQYTSMPIDDTPAMVPWGRSCEGQWKVGTGADQYTMPTPKTLDEYCKFLATDKSWLAQAELELAAHLLPPSSRLFTFQVGKCSPAHIRPAGYTKNTERVIARTPRDCRPQDVVVVFDGVGHWTATSPLEWEHEWPLHAFLTDAEHDDKYNAMMAHVNAQQDKQAVKMRNLSQYTVVGPYMLTPGMMVKVNATDANFAGKLDAGSIITAVHSMLHERSYVVISEAGPLDKCFSRQQLEGVMDPHNNIKHVGHNGSKRLQEQFQEHASQSRASLNLVSVGKAIVKLSSFGGARGTLPKPASQKRKTRPLSPKSERDHKQHAKGSSAKGSAKTN